MCVHIGDFFIRCYGLALSANLRKTAVNQNHLKYKALKTYCFLCRLRYNKKHGITEAENAKLVIFFTFKFMFYQALSALYDTMTDIVWSKKNCVFQPQASKAHLRYIFAWHTFLHAA